MTRLKSGGGAGVDAAKRCAKDWGAADRLEARISEAALLRAVPKQWAAGVRAMKTIDRAEPLWMRDGMWRERLEAFRLQHGDALAWALWDSEICERAKAIALHVDELLTLWPEPLIEVERLDVVRMVCQSVGVPEPVAITGAGAVARGVSAVWWRRVLRKKVARVVEHGAIRLGVVNRYAGGYASDYAVERRGEQLARNALILSKAVMRNEAGQFYTLADLAKTSTANPEIRGGELMTRIRGCEEFSQEEGHVGIFCTMTTPSRFHAVTVGGNTAAARPRANPLYDGVSTPRDAQQWLCKMWARARAELARMGIVCYGFRVAEPHHDGTPHWHALLWSDSESSLAAVEKVIKKHWLSEFADERGADKFRTNFKRMVGGGAAGYMAKYIAKNIGHFDVGGHLDEADGLQVMVWAGDVKGWQRVDAWASTWGIRQFQSIGQPSVTVWRELRRVTGDQVEAARVQGEAVAWKAWGAVHRVGDTMACWARYMRAMGGACLARLDYRIQPAKRVTEVVNCYGETILQKKTVGVELQSGRWLISRRQAWTRVFDSVSVSQSPAERAACGAPWTGFNNCTARLTGRLRAALLGRDGGRIAGALP